MTPPDDRPRAVLVEDNLMFALMVEPPLKKLGYDVRSLAGGGGAAEQIAACAPGVVFVNLASGRFDGAALIRELRSRTDLAAIPVIGYAGHVERHLLQAGRDAGATLVVPNSALRKALPQVLEKLRARIGGEPAEEWPDEDD